MSDREHDCLTLVAKGWRVAQIADHLGVSEVTVNFHLRNARKKLGARTLPETVAKAINLNFIEI